MANLTLEQELAELRTRVRKFQRKVVKEIRQPKYYSTLRILNDGLHNADGILSECEPRLKEYLRENGL